MEKCSFCVQRIQRSTREGDRNGLGVQDGDRGLNPACVNACPTGALNFGNFADSDSQVSRMKADAMGEQGRGYGLMENLGTDPNVVYLKKVDESAEVSHGH